MRSSVVSDLSKNLWYDEHGYTTVSMVLALLLSIALIFSSAQVYRVNSISAEIQDVADAAVLASENKVAEFVLIARICDALVFSLSFSSLVATGIGIVALCTPATAGVSETFLNIGHKFAQARNSFSKQAITTLNAMQRVLPFAAAVKASQVAKANNVMSEGAAYKGVTLLVPFEVEPLSDYEFENADDFQSEAEQRKEEIKHDAGVAEEKAEEALLSKKRAYIHDCGAYPEFCMRERAEHLAGLPLSKNPQYHSTDTWSFEVALQRAQSYYEARENSSIPQESIDNTARAYIRSYFYQYAQNELQDAYVTDTEEQFSAYFPLFYRSLDELRETSAYGVDHYPVSCDDDGQMVMHAWRGCPNCNEVDHWGSIKEYELCEYLQCPNCGFTASDAAKVACASSYTETGFEYHYRIVAEEAVRYQKLVNEGKPWTFKVKGHVSELFSRLTDACTEASRARIDPNPPGSYGSIAIVVNAEEPVSSGIFDTPLVHVEGRLGTRIAVSAATLLEGDDAEGKDILSSLLTNVEKSNSGISEAGQDALEIWARLLMGYKKGEHVLSSSIEGVLDKLPLAGPSGLGRWASGKLTDLISDIGIQSPNLCSVKPVLINSGHVASHLDGEYAAQYIEIKRKIIEHPLRSTSVATSMFSEFESEIYKTIDQTETLKISLGKEGSGIVLEIPIPDCAKERSKGIVSEGFEALRRVTVDAHGERVWE